MAHDVLIVEADEAGRRRLAEIASRLDLSCRLAPDGAAALAEAAPGAFPPQLVLLDLGLPDIDGLTVLAAMRDAFHVPIIVIAGAGDPQLGDRAFAAGASDLIVKPAADDRLEAAIRSALTISALEGEIARIRRRRDGRPNFTDIVAGTLEMQRALTLGRRAADLELPVLIEGEPGTGRETMARAIFGGSARSSGVFHSVECARLQESFNGAEPGLAMQMAWSAAAGGVLFLGEIGDLPLAAQAKLSGHLASEPGFARDGKPSVRLICTSSRNLIEKVKKEQFREDLYYRINVFPVWLPPLRDRTEDIPGLASHFLAQVIAEEGKRIETIEPAALALLKSYVWPGNVRQLEKAIFRAVVLAEGETLTLPDFPQILAQVPEFRPDAAAQIRPAERPAAYHGPAMIGGAWPVTRPIAVAPAPHGATLGIPALTEDGEIRRLDDIEADMIRLALGHYRGHITEVARRLGIGRSTLYRKMREFGLDLRHG